MSAPLVRMHKGTCRIDVPEQAVGKWAQAGFARGDPVPPPPVPEPAPEPDPGPAEGAPTA